MNSNRHPVDQLADIRNQIRRLKAREDELRGWVLAHPTLLVGDEHVAFLQPQSTEHFDLQTAKKAVGSALRPFVIENRSVRVGVGRKE